MAPGARAHSQRWGASDAPDGALVPDARRPTARFLCQKADCALLQGLVVDLCPWADCAVHEPDCAIVGLQLLDDTRTPARALSA